MEAFCKKLCTRQTRRDPPEIPARLETSDDAQPPAMSKRKGEENMPDADGSAAAKSAVRKVMSAKTAMSIVPNLMHHYHPFPQKATAALQTAESAYTSPQTQSQAYRLAWADEPFLLRDDLRPLRLQLEYTKPELKLQEAGIDSTIVVFGSARYRDKETADKMLHDAQAVVAAKGPDDKDAQRSLAHAQRMVSGVKYYEAAQKFGTLVTKNSDGNKLVVITGGGPGIMEAANRGATEIPGGRSVGLNIVLPFEQHPNPYITPELCFNFHYFSMRKMHFLGRARALVAFPGGWGTMDELFEALTLIQTKKMAPIPVILFCKAWWDKIVDFPNMLEEGVISDQDLSLFSYAETPEEAWEHISKFYQGPHLP
ncbi:hypothetical protein DFS34DRAFT_504516 [Phlyctochytrium arcticum]|nr:hypothetical protein DFS34DRAFT_504516 [Phlyctochytrium arcticum]